MIFRSLRRNTCPDYKRLLVVFIVLTATILFSGTISLCFSALSDYTLPTSGTIKTVDVEIYLDSTLQNKLEVIDWGIIYAGTTKNVTLHIRNLSNTNTIIQLNTLSLNPIKFSNYVSLNWDYDGAFLTPNEVIEVNLLLTISNNKVLKNYLLTEGLENFSIDIIISVVEKNDS